MSPFDAKHCDNEEHSQHEKVDKVFQRIKFADRMNLVVFVCSTQLVPEKKLAKANCYFYCLRDYFKGNHVGRQFVLSRYELFFELLEFTELVSCFRLKIAFHHGVN